MRSAWFAFFISSDCVFPAGNPNGLSIVYVVAGAAFRVGFLSNIHARYKLVFTRIVSELFTGDLWTGYFLTEMTSRSRKSDTGNYAEH